MSRTAVDKMFHKYAVAAGFTSTRTEEKITPHCARHWFTNELMEADMPREQVEWLRGDSGNGAIDKYIHINPETVRAKYLTLIPPLGLI
jgi:site-specific recombinase XerD